MPRGDKSSYTDKQKRQVKHIEEGYLEQGLSKEEAARRAWACLLYTSPSPRDQRGSRMPSSA